MTECILRPVHCQQHSFHQRTLKIRQYNQAAHINEACEPGSKGGSRDQAIEISFTVRNVGSQVEDHVAPLEMHGVVSEESKFMTTISQGISSVILTNSEAQP